MSQSELSSITGQSFTPTTRAENKTPNASQSNKSAIPRPVPVDVTSILNSLPDVEAEPQVEVTEEDLKDPELLVRSSTFA